MRARDRTRHLKLALREYHDNILESRSVQRERTRLADDFHDGLQHLITAASYQLERTESLQDDPAAMRDQFKKVRVILEQTKDEVRRAIWDLNKVPEDTSDLANLFQRATKLMAHWLEGATKVAAIGSPCMQPTSVARNCSCCVKNLLETPSGMVLPARSQSRWILEMTGFNCGFATTVQGLMWIVPVTRAAATLAWLA